MNPLDLVKAAAWEQAVFSTFALSLSFFEALVLDSLMRGGSKQALILTDPEGLRAGLSEHGARRAGRDYEISAVAKSGGYFHPKISAFVAQGDAHLLVGSGNLTFGGWGGNLECIDHLHTSFAADAFDDAARFYESLSSDSAIRFDAKAKCDELAAALRAAVGSTRRSGRVRLAHSLGRSIAEQIAEACDGLGGAERLTIVSPFYDVTGRGIDDLAATLACDDMRLHAHSAGAVRGKGSFEWPFDRKQKPKAVALEDDFPADARPLHAKCFELRCKRGIVRVSGSANATHAGLYGHNVEASVIRILPRATTYWAASKGTSPGRIVLDADDAKEEHESRVGILSATLDAGRLRGRVITPRRSGQASAVLETFDEILQLGQINISNDGRFDFPASGLERVSFEHGRLLLRLVLGEETIEGIVAIRAASELIKRMGAMAPRIFAMLAGTETPADVAAMMAWLRDDPSRWPTRAATAGSSSEDGDREEPEAVTVSLFELEEAAARQRDGAQDGKSGRAAWYNTMALYRASFRRPRGPFGAGGETDDDDDDEDIEEKKKRAREAEYKNRKSLKHFEDILPEMLDPENEYRDPMLALSCAHFLADRIRPAPQRLRSWLTQILPHIAAFDEDDDGFAVSAALVHFAAGEQPEGAMRTRRYLLRRNVDPAVIQFNPDVVPAFLDLLNDDIGAGELADAVRAARTPSEQVQAYCAAAVGTGERTGFPLLQQSPYWPKLEAALEKSEAFTKVWISSKIEVCPRCNLKLPLAKYYELRDIGVTFCCAHLLNGEA